MKLVVFGGTGKIGAKLVEHARGAGHEVVVASRSTGINAVTGEGLAEALSGAEVVVDMLNSPVFEDRAVLKFFEQTTRNLLAAEQAAGVRHHVALSIVGTARLQSSGYLRAKAAQERLVESGPIPYTLVQAPQFHEFVQMVGDWMTVDGVVRAPSALMQPISAAAAAAAVYDVAVGTPKNATIEIGGPELIGMDDLIRLDLAARNDPRTVVTDPAAAYFGAPLEQRSLVAEDDAPRFGPTFAEWLRQPAGSR